MAVKKSVGKGVVKSVEIRGTDPEKRWEYFLKRSFIGDNCQICSFAWGQALQISLVVSCDL